MSGNDEDDKPTVVLDLNALKKQKLKQEEDLAKLASELEFNVFQEDAPAEASRPSVPKDFSIILFDFQSDLFKNSLDQFPPAMHCQIVTNLDDLNRQLRSRKFQFVVFNYDVNPKAVNHLCAQLKVKFPSINTIITARLISAEKAKIHASTPYGASGYYELPIMAQRFEEEVMRIHLLTKKVG